MKVFVSMSATEDENKFVVEGWSSSPDPSSIEFEIEEGDNFFNSFGQYSVVDGQLVHDVDRVNKETEEKEAKDAEAARKDELIKNLESILAAKDEENQQLSAKVTSLTRSTEDLLDLVMSSLF